MRHNDHSLLFKWACNFLKYFLLALLGFAITCILSASFGAFHFVELLFSALGYWLFRLAVFTVCFLATAILLEALNN